MATACPSDSYYRHRQLAVEPAIAAWGGSIKGRGVFLVPLINFLTTSRIFEKFLYAEQVPNEPNHF